MRIFRLFKKDLAREVSDWVDAGIIEASQGDAILARYGMKLSDAKGGSFGYYVLTALAVMFVAQALMLIVSHNWDEIPRMTRMLGLIGLTLVVNLVGLRMLLRERYRAGVLWLLFGGISYGVSIMLIAQIYHLGEHFPDGIFWWSLGVLPLLFITQSRLIALLELALATTWMFSESSTEFFPVSYPLFALACIWLVWVHKPSMLIFLLALGGLLTWFNLLLAWGAGGWDHYHLFADQIPVTIAVGLVLTGFAWWMMRRGDHRMQEYGQILHLYLLRAGIVVLFILSYDDSWRALLRGDYLLGVFTPLLLALGTIAGFYLARASGVNASGPLLLNGIYFTLAALCVQQQWLNSLHLAVATNLVLVVTGIWLIRRGIDDAITHFFYTGVGVLLLLALFRYFDLIGDYIGGALLFIVAAGVLFAAAHYWRKRSRQGDEHV